MNSFNYYYLILTLISFSSNDYNRIIRADYGDDVMYASFALEAMREWARWNDLALSLGWPKVKTTQMLRWGEIIGGFIEMEHKYEFRYDDVCIVFATWQWARISLSCVLGQPKACGLNCRRASGRDDH
jgi:hypothetical protein